MVLSTARSDWTRRYPSLILLACAVVLAAFALPSSLILPQASPAQTLEYAPVPPNGQAPPGGNLSALGLGSTGTLGSNGTGGSGLPDLGPGEGRSPSGKECVGNPPRQTEDPLSPPCVAFYAGDNGGATYQGVTRREIRVLFLVDPYSSDNGCGGPSPVGYYEDLMQAPDSSDNTCIPEVLRGWMRYFNFRFQTYNRTVHFWLYWATSTTGPQQRQSDAADNIAKLHPFAVVLSNMLYQGYLDSYQQSMNRAGVFVFTSSAFQPNATYQRYAPLLWGYAPSAEEQARSYATYVCQKVKPYPVSYSGEPAFQGKPRIYGLIETTDPAAPLLAAYQKLAAGYIQSQCGLTFRDTAYYPVDGWAVYADASDTTYNSYAQPQMARFSSEGITTIIWPTGFEDQFSKAATQGAYLPEWITGGDGGHSDGWNSTLFQDKTAWAYAWVVSYEPYVTDGNGSEVCRSAFSSEDQGTASKTTYPCNFYAPLLQLFTGIQVSGPNLNRQTMDEGYHAIPAHRSTDPQTPACYYDPGDYTCVKDAVAEWWDPQTPNSGGSPGCFRMPDRGARYLSGGWPAGNIDAQQNRSADPCNEYPGDINTEVKGPQT